ncbi:MAG TPA: transcription antitermination factor NusB [Chitinophagales bacterium]|nr:transcription antitermination factor NusB [Chitinophagales bacterium]
MLSRRNLRVKVMQVLYSIEHNNQTASSEAVGMLERSIEKAYTLLAFNLSLIVRIADYIRREWEIKTSKFLPTDEDLHFSTRLAGNPFINALRQSKQVSAQLRLALSEEENALVKALFKKLSDESEYKLYCEKKAVELKEERKILLFAFSKVIFKHPAYLQYVEDNFPECLSELGKINFTTAEMIEKLSPDAPNGLLAFLDTDTEANFAKELLEKTLANNQRFTALIEPKLKNWDVDRIARLDMILMKMALCELLCFEQIPVKVSINEYIDISKSYSTPRSKDFINGILDNVMHELREKNEIKKTGRGLVE